jgi:hypothetical protein
MKAERARRMGTWGAALTCAVGLAIAATVERASEERANRLQRGGASAEAARSYGERVARERTRADTVPVRLAYNFGTALLGVGSPVADAHLAAAASAADPMVRVRALYNLGLWHLLRARDSGSADSVRAHAGRSVNANKDALRLEPGRADARWNLALAQRMLDSLNAQGGPAGSEATDGATDSDERLLSDELREFEQGSEVSDAPREGSDEALAQGDEASLLSPIEAEGILITDADRSVIVRKLLTYAGRTRRRVATDRASLRW